MWALCQLQTHRQRLTVPYELLSCCEVDHYILQCRYLYVAWRRIWTSSGRLPAVFWSTMSRYLQTTRHWRKSTSSEALRHHQPAIRIHTLAVWQGAIPNGLLSVYLDVLPKYTLFFAQLPPCLNSNWNVPCRKSVCLMPLYRVIISALPFPTADTSKTVIQHSLTQITLLGKIADRSANHVPQNN